MVCDTDSSGGLGRKAQTDFELDQTKPETRDYVISFLSLLVYLCVFSALFDCLFRITSGCITDAACKPSEAENELWRTLDNGKSSTS